MRTSLFVGIAVSVIALSPFVVSAEQTPPMCPQPIGQKIQRVNMERIRKNWLTMYNRIRKAQGLPPYELDDTLNQTATVWSQYSADRGNIEHKRYADSAYYDYKQIEEWFSGQGLTFTNVNGKTFTENIGWGPYNCASVDCTFKLQSAIRSTLRFFLSEKNKTYQPHYASIMSPAFKKIGLGIAINPDQKRYYLTVHYGTEVDVSCLASQL